MDTVVENNEEEQEYSDDLGYEIKMRYRFFRKRWSAFWRKQIKKNFSQILIVTTKEPPIDYICAIQKQYPDKIIKVIVPHISDNFEQSKTIFSFDYFLQNKTNEAKLMLMKQKKDNIEIYSVYSSAFVGITENINNIKYLAHFLKCVRICAKIIKPDIIQSDNIPFFLGAEFEPNLRLPYKVFQIVDDFSLYEDDAFWSILNICDKKAMKKICRDKIIKKCIASLFNIQITENFVQMKDCLETIYDRYLLFKSIQTQEEDFVFKRLDSRIIAMFPAIFPKSSIKYNSIINTIKKADFWATTSKTYYKALYNNLDKTNNFDNLLKCTKSKSDCVKSALSYNDGVVSSPFTAEDFRENRGLNKKYLLKELSHDRILTKFTDISLIAGDAIRICGYLDSFYDAPLVIVPFINADNDEGLDVAISVILKLFEMNKNVQVIFNVQNQIRNNILTDFVEFCEKQSALNGRWIFIEGKINYPIFFAASDFIMLPYRKNSSEDTYLKAIKFGCVPIVTSVGSLNDNIVDIFDDMTTGCGFKTEKNIRTKEEFEQDFLKTTLKAINFYSQNPSSFNVLIKNCLEYDTSWNFKIIEKYNDIYEELL